MLKTLPISDLSEPGGISYDVETRQLYIADTNNHRIKVTALPENLDEATHLDTSEVRSSSYFNITPMDLLSCSWVMLVKTNNPNVLL